MAVVTGAASDIGEATPRRLSGEGARCNPNVLSWLLGRAPTSFADERQKAHERHSPLATGQRPC